MDSRLRGSDVIQLKIGHIMKIILEIEKTDNLQRIERFLKLLQPYTVTVQHDSKQQKIANFLDFIDKKSTTVDKIIIPDREERNAR